MVVCVFSLKTWRNTAFFEKSMSSCKLNFQRSYIAWVCSRLSMSAHLVAPEELRKTLRPRGWVGLEHIVFKSSGKGWKYSHASQTQPVWVPFAFSITHSTETILILNTLWARVGWIRLARLFWLIHHSKSWSTSSFLSIKSKVSSKCVSDTW